MKRSAGWFAGGCHETGLNAAQGFGSRPKRSGQTWCRVRIRKVRGLQIQFGAVASARKRHEAHEVMFVFRHPTACGRHEAPVPSAFPTDGPHDPCHGNDELRPFDVAENMLRAIEGCFLACDVTCHVTRRDKAQDGQRENLRIVRTNVSKRQRMISSAVIVAAHHVILIV
jgi:hypothetical protein